MVPSLEGVELMAVLLGDAKRLAAHAVPSGCPAALPAGVPTSGAKPACDGDATCTPSEIRPWSMHYHKHVILMLHEPPAIREGASADEQRQPYPLLTRQIQATPSQPWHGVFLHTAILELPP